MKKNLIILISVLFICGCTNSNIKSYTSISADKAYQMIRNEDVIIIDVRSKEEYNTGHVKGAINIAHDVIANEIKKVTTDLDKKIIIYCRSGARAETASNVLVDLGYTNVYTFGGLNSWQYELTK